MKNFKTILGVTAGLAVAAVAVVAMAHASTALTVSCSGVVSGNQVTWTAASSGGNAPYAFAWSGDGGIAGATSTAVVGTYGANGTYTSTIQVTDASTTVATSTCSQTVTSFVAPVTPTSTPTTTPPLPRVNQQQLSIGPNGSFLARGMTVTSVGSNSFQASVWGITYTVNWSGNLFPEFYFRDGHGSTPTSSPTVTLQVGDEVGVQGRIVSTSDLMTVNANVVRDYSVTKARPGKREGQSDSPFYNGIGVQATGTVSSSAETNLRLQDLLKQFQNLQNLFNHGNGNGNGNGKGNGGDH